MGVVAGAWAAFSGSAVCGIDDGTAADLKPNAADQSVVGDDTPTLLLLSAAVCCCDDVTSDAAAAVAALADCSVAPAAGALTVLPLTTTPAAGSLREKPLRPNSERLLSLASLKKLLLP